MSASLDASGLNPRTTYHFRLVAVNKYGSTAGPDATFYTSDTPTIEGEAVASVSATAAVVSARVNPSGLPTTYLLQYGTSSGYGSHTAEVSAGAGREPTEVQVQLTGLTARTTYYARLLATNTDGTATGTAALSFTTSAQGSSTALALPDNREYELVSDMDSAGEVYVPVGPRNEHKTTGGHHHRTAVPVGGDGESVVYVAAFGEVGGSGLTGGGLGDQFLGQRSSGAGRWDVSTLTPQASILMAKVVRRRMKRSHRICRSVCSTPFRGR